MSAKMDAVLKKKELDAKPDKEAAKNFDSYKELHDQSQFDMDRSLQHRLEAMDEEERRLVDEEQHFDEEYVLREKNRGLDNIANLKDVVDRQDFVYRAIMGKVNEGAEVPQKSSGKEQARADSRESMHRASPYPVQDSDSNRVQHSCVVANELSRRKLHAEGQKQRSCEIRVKQAQSLEALCRKHELQDRQAEERQQKLIERQIERTSAAQHRRSEQQKMLKEIQRDQDHQFELLQLKHHPAAVSTIKSAASPSMSPPRTPSGEQSRMYRSSSEPIYNHVMESHKLYATTLSRWRDFELDNERRTDAYWRKMLGESRRKHTHEARDSKDRGNGAVFRHAAKTITHVRTFVQRTSNGSMSDSDAPLPGSFIDDGFDVVDTTNVSDGGSIQLMMSGRTSSAGSLSKPKSSSYQSRREQVIEYHRELERTAHAKMEADRAYLEEKRRLGKEFQNSKASAAGDLVKAWEQKNAITTQKRKELAVVNDGEFALKSAAADQRINHRQGNLERTLSTMTQNKNNMSNTVKAAGNKNLEDRVGSFKSKQAEKDERGDELLAVRMSQNERRANSGYAELVEQKCAQKKRDEAEFRKKTHREVKAKMHRQHECAKRLAGKEVTEASQRDHAKAMERQRLLRESKGRNNPDRAPLPELTLPPELALPAHLFLSPKSAASPTEATPGTGQASAASPTGDSVLPTPGDTPTVSDAVGHELSDVFKKRVGAPRKPAAKANQTPSSVQSMSGGLGLDGNLAATGGSGESDHSSNVSEEEESEGEANFLEDIRVQSSKWLQDMRKDSNPLST